MADMVGIKIEDLHLKFREVIYQDLMFLIIMQRPDNIIRAEANNINNHLSANNILIIASVRAGMVKANMADINLINSITRLATLNHLELRTAAG